MTLETSPTGPRNGGSRIQHVLPLFVATAVVVLVTAAARGPNPASPRDLVGLSSPDVASLRRQVDTALSTNWEKNNIQPALGVEDLQVLRRLSLSLHGCVPSLEEIRQFEADESPDRLGRWTQRFLSDRRFADYFAARLARAFVGAEGGQFLVFRRDRFTTWLSDQIHENRPLDEVVREMMADTGLWTGVPATNFITQALADDVLDYNKLAGRTVRAFLGQRIDCAQCHNHPFAEWKQSQFEGLAACYGEVFLSPTGVGDNPEKSFKVTDRMTLEERAVPPAVPFGQEWWPAVGSTRQRLAAWVTHPQNQRFERAIANRVWGLIFGRPFQSPVDDLPDPPPSSAPDDVLGLLGRDFREHRYDLKRLVTTITASAPFHLSSQHPAYGEEQSADLLEEKWAVYPLVRLRPEQMIGSMCQAASIKTMDPNSHLFTRTIRFFRELDFVREYGDLGDAELEERSGTIPQALLRMNGRLAQEIGNANPFNSPGRVAAMSPTDADAIDTIYLCCVSRRPTDEERQYLLSLREGPEAVSRAEIIEDLVWSLFNSPEFCWNH